MPTSKIRAAVLQVRAHEPRQVRCRGRDGARGGEHRDVLREVLHAATRASSSGNMQTYSVIVTKDAARRISLSAI